MHLGAAYIMLTGPRPGIDSPANLGYGIQTLTVIVADVVLISIRQSERVRLSGKSSMKLSMERGSTA